MTGTMAEPLISIRNLCRSFGDVKAVDNISLDIAQGEFFALLGPSGCGKTTLMRMIAGFDAPDSGTIMFDGHDISAVPANRRPFNMMFQSYALFPHMSVEKNIGFGLKQDGYGAAEIKERVEEMLTLVQLQGLGGRKPHQISGGQCQRVALARALAKKPKLLLLDEPLAALDSKLREETRLELVDLQEQLGMTFIIVTHDQEEAMTVASRMAVMKDGRFLQTDEPARIYEHPANAFVADFVGDVNLLDITVARIEGGLLYCAWPAGRETIMVRVQDGEKFSPGEGLKLVLRPEKIRLAAKPPRKKKAVNMMQGIIEDISYIGSTSTFRVRMESGAVIKVEKANRGKRDMRKFTWDDRIWIYWHAASSVALREQEQ